jgi:hypothetical protein
MSAISNTFQTYGAVGIREDLSDVIYNISPTSTPFLSSAQRGKAEQTFFEWQTDVLAAASTANQQIEGDDITTFDTEVPTVRMGNYTQISRKTLIISDTEEVVNKAGRKSELSYQLAKKGKELKRDMEANLLANLGASAGNSTTARVTGSLLAFIKSNIDKAANGVVPVYTNVPTDVWTTGTPRAFTETILKNVIQKCWTAGAEPKVIMVGALGKQAVSTFAGIAAKRMNQDSAEATAIIGAADAYVSDFGTLTVVPNRFQRPSDAFVLDYDFIEVDYLRPFKQVPLSKTGDAEKRLLIVEYGLRVKNEQAEGLATDLTP